MGFTSSSHQITPFSFAPDNSPSDAKCAPDTFWPAPLELVRVDPAPKKTKPKKDQVVSCNAYPIDESGWPKNASDIQHFGDEVEWFRRAFFQRQHMFKIDPRMKPEQIGELLWQCSPQGELVRKVVRGMDQMVNLKFK